MHNFFREIIETTIASEFWYQLVQVLYETIYCFPIKLLFKSSKFVVNEASKIIKLMPNWKSENTNKTLGKRLYLFWNNDKILLFKNYSNPDFVTGIYYRHKSRATFEISSKWLYVKKNHILYHICACRILKPVTIIIKTIWHITILKTIWRIWYIVQFNYLAEFVMSLYFCSP